MAVDPTLHRLYILEGGKTGANEAGGTTTARQIRILSTIPKEGKLVSPGEGPTTLPLPKGTEVLVEPHAIAVDPVTHEVEVMAENKSGTKHTILQRVTSSGTIAGKFTDTGNKLRVPNESAASMAIGPTGTTYFVYGRPDKPGVGHTKGFEVPENLSEIKEIPGFAAALAAEEWPNGVAQSSPSKQAQGPRTRDLTRRLDPVLEGAGGRCRRGAE